MREIPEELTMCHGCGTLHFNPNKRCPECGAGLYYQCNEDLNGNTVLTPKYAAKAYVYLANTLKKRAEYYDNLSKEFGEQHECNNS